MLRREIGLEADLGGIRLATSVVSLTPGSVPATEPKRLPWVTPKGPAAQQEEPLLSLLSRLRYRPHAQRRGRGRQAWVHTSTLPRPLSRTLCFSRCQAPEIQPVPGDGRCGETWSQPLETSVSWFSQQHQLQNNSGGLGETDFAKSLPCFRQGWMGHPNRDGE